MDEVVSGGFCTTKVGAKCGRWNPTAEQVKVLTDLFALGLRTPTTDQIQKISSRLGKFGKIESKNVFYWFQNHKARERHHKKRRRGNSGGGSDIHVIAPDINRKETRVNVHEIEEGEIETLELFPLSSYEGEKTRKLRSEWREISFADHIAGREYPPLDLRLSFL